MKPYLSILLSTLLVLSTTSVQAVTDLRSSLPIASKESAVEHFLTTENDILPGESSSRTYTYTIFGDERADSSKFLSLDWAHSELLIPPSALTIDIDGEPLQSIALTKDTAQGNIKIPLQNDHLTKGTHEITLRYTGIVKGRMCDTGNTSGSWFMIRPSSFVSVGENVELSLNNYPNPFTQTTNQKLTVVLPDSPDASSLEAGLLLYRQLKGDATETNNVSIQYEQQLKSLGGRYIFVGQTDAFTGPVKTLIDHLNLSLEENEVLLEQVRLVDGKSSTNAMFVLADNAEAFEGTLDHLLVVRQRQQLSGHRLTLASAPAVHRPVDTVNLRALGASDLMLSGSQAVSSNYYYPLPLLDDQSVVDIEVRFKTSKNLMLIEEQSLAPELIAWVNGTPHSIPLTDTEEHTDWQHHTISVDASTLERASFLDVSFEANGLRSEAPCTASDLDRWIFVSSDSQVSLPSSDGNANNEVFLNMMSLFSAPSGIVFVVPDDTSNKSLQNIASIMNGLPITPLTTQIEFARSSELKEEMVADRSVFFIGDPDQSPLLKNEKKNWLVTTDNQVDLAQYGFIPETSSEYAWIQPSPWNKERAMIVVSTTDTIDSSLIQTLAFPSETFSVAVKNQNGAIFTNSSSVAGQSKDKEGATKQVSSDVNSTWYFIGFVVLIVLVISILLFIRRKK